MTQSPAIFWDFDGTLASRPFMWSAAFARALSERPSGGGLTAESIKPHLQTGFPWHSPAESWADHVEPAMWWGRMETHFASVFVKLGILPPESRDLARRVHELAVQPDDYVVFPDVHEVLGALKAIGFRQYVLSNHMPELDEIVHQLGLREYFERVFTSALIGYSKPHPEVFDRCLLAADAAPENTWMIGDNMVADIRGAGGAGMRAILVRSQPIEDVRFQCDDLHAVVPILAVSSG